MTKQRLPKPDSPLHWWSDVEIRTWLAQIDADRLGKLRYPDGPNPNRPFPLIPKYWNKPHVRTGNIFKVARFVDGHVNRRWFYRFMCWVRRQLVKKGWI